MNKHDQMIIQADHEKWAVDDPNYDVAKNKAVIEQTIKDYEAMRAQKVTQYDEGYAMRADALSSYLKHLASNGHNNMERYFGKRALAEIRGNEIRDKLMNGLGVVANGK